MGYSDQTKKDLLKLAKERDLDVTSKNRKQEIIDALEADDATGADSSEESTDEIEEASGDGSCERCGGTGQVTDHRGFVTEKICTACSVEDEIVSVDGDVEIEL